MAGIPTVPGSELDVNTPEKAVRLNEGALNARYQGERALASGIEQVGETVGGIGEEIQKAKNIGIAADVDLKMRTARQTFIESLRNDSNQDGWTTRAQETASTVRDDIFSENEKLPPGMRAEVDSAFKSWQGNLLTETQSLANAQTVNRAWGKVRADYNDALKDGQADHAATLMAHARDTKMANPAEIDQMERDIPRTIATNYIENGLRTNPQGTTELLQSGAALPANDQNGKPIVPSQVLSPREMTALVNTGRVRTAAWQKTNFEDILATRADPITGLIPENVIKDGMANRQIGEQTGRNFLAAQERKVLADTAKKASDLAKEDNQKLSMITAKVHDPVAWGVNPDVYAHDLTTEAADIANPTVRQRAISDINRQVAAVKKTGQTADKPVISTQLKFMTEAFENGSAFVPMTEGKAAVEHIYGDESAVPSDHVPGGIKAIEKMQPDEIKEKFGDKATKEGVIEAAKLNFATKQKQFLDWAALPENANATPEQANAERQRLERPDARAAVAATITKKIPRAVSTQTEFDELEPGDPFIFNGRVGTKH